MATSASSTASGTRSVNRLLGYVLGIVYLLVGVLGFVVPMLLGLIPHGFSVVDNIIHLALGVAGLAVAFSSRGGAPARA